MTFDYAAIASEVAEILREFGASTTLKRPATADYDPTTGTNATTPATEQSVTAVVFPYADKHVDGTLILATDQQAFLSASGVTAPNPGDLLTWGGVDRNVVKTRNLGPAGVFVFYECQLR
jgi:hypothetical protein